MPRPTAALIAALAGAASLAVELVWMRRLSLAFGSASLAAGAVVAAIMLGMALGSVAATRSSANRLGPSLLALAAVAGASPFVLDVLSGKGVFGAAGAALFMIAAGIPMGMTVPLLAAGRDPRAAGALYAWNTLGASAGILAAGFLLLPALGNLRTLAVSAAVLAVLGGVALAVRRRDTVPPTAPETRLPLTDRQRWVLLAYAASAFAAMVAEIGWMRGLALSVGSSTYANTLVLGVYVAGLGLGGALSARFLAGRPHPGRAFGVLQLLLAAAGLVAVVVVGRMPDLFGRFFGGRIGSLATFSAAALASSSVALLPPTVLVGACFPAALAWLGPSPRATGLLLATATAASMLGALAASFASIPSLGVEGTLVAALLVHLAAGAAVLLVGRRVWPALAAAALAVLVAVRPRWDVHVTQSGPYLYGRGEASARVVLFAQDDHVASVAVFERPDGNRLLRIDGKTDASMSPTDLVTQLLTAHIPLSLHPAPRRVALVGLGSGMTLAACLKHAPERIDCMEISPAVVRASRFFDAETGAPLDDPRVRLHVADARAAMRAAEGTFDAILNEPSNLWIAGMAGLFSEEFYITCRSRLARGGVMGQWIHAYALPPQAFRDAIATFLRIFPHATLWEMRVSGDYLLVGSTEGAAVDVDALRARTGSSALAADLRKIGIESVDGLLCDLVAGPRELATVAAGARIQTDDGLHLEFTAPLGFYGKTVLPALEVLPPVDAVALGAVVRGRDVSWAGARESVRGAIRANVQGRRSEVFARLVEALREFPEERQARMLLEVHAGQCIAEAREASRADRDGEARARFDEVPREAWAYVESRLRKAAMLKGATAPWREVAEEYARVLEAAPGHEVGTAGLVEARTALGEPEEAERIASQLLELRPRSALLRLVRGRARAATNRAAEAEADWREARRLDPAGSVGREAARLLGDRP